MHKYFGKQDDHGLFVMADLGLTCGGNLERAVQLIEAAAHLGTDAVKFQMLDAEALLGDKSVTYTYPTLTSGDRTENMHEMFTALAFSDEEWNIIKEECVSKGLELVVTCHTESTVERVEKLDLRVNKICTWSLSHYRMINQLAKNGKPLILDTGTINRNELNELESYYRNAGGGDIIILHDFHTDVAGEMNFRVIRELINSGYEVGYTPQGRKDWLDYMAIGLGAKFVEKRLTLSREIPENGHWKAHNMDEFSEWMTNLKECYEALGDGNLVPTQQDLKDAEKYYKSAWLVKDVEKGELIKDECFEFKRPGVGISSKQIIERFLGTNFKKSYIKGEMFTG